MASLTILVITTMIRLRSGHRKKWISIDASQTLRVPLPKIKIYDSSWQMQKLNMIVKFVEFVKKPILDVPLKKLQNPAMRNCKLRTKSFR